MFDAPQFWYQPTPTLAARALQPVGYMLRALAHWRLYGIKEYACIAPIICLGNASVGGTGKTPLAMAIADILYEAELQPIALTRGYGGSVKKPVKVDAFLHDYRAVGDEALLLDSCMPTIAAKNRVEGAVMAARLGAHAIICDDGLQNHPSLYRDCALLVVPQENSFGNGCLLPAGPLREPVASALNKVHGVVMVGTQHPVPPPPIIAQSGKPVFYARKVPTGGMGDVEAGTRVLAFAGIGHPEGFFNMLRTLGYDVVRTHAFADHQPYSWVMAERLVREAESLNAIAITTDKDMVRLPADYRGLVVPFSIKLAFADDDRLHLAQLISQRIGAQISEAIAGRGALTRG